MAKLNKYTLALLLLTVFYCSCNKNKEPVRVLLDYSFDNGWTHSYSIKVYTDGKAYLKKSTLTADSIYVNNQADINTLNEIISKLKVAKIANKYEDIHTQDAPSFNAIVYYDKSKASKYYVYGNKYPELLNEIKGYSNAFLKQNGWHQLKDTTVAFASLTSFKIIPKVDTNARFLPPEK